MSQRKVDSNGYWEIEDNPISKAGVFPYLGAQLPGAPDPTKVYMVLRPPEELGAPETVDSFKLQPWIIHHEMLGPENQGLTPPEEKGVHGVIGEKVRFDAETDTLYGNIKGFSEELKAAVANGLKELSSAYFHDLEWKSGSYKGQRYDAIQRNIRGNHLASVPSGRMGPEVAVMDSLRGYGLNIFTIRKEPIMPDNQELTLEKLAEGVTALAERLDRLEGAKASATDNDEDGDKPAQDNQGAGQDNDGQEGKSGEAAGKDNAGAAQDNGDGEDKDKTAAAQDNQGAAAADNAAAKDNAQGEEKAQSMDAMEKALVQRLAGRDQLAQRLVPHVGTFDHALMTAADVAAYGCNKLGLKPPKGQEATALDAYLAGAGKTSQRVYAMDTAMPGANRAGWAGSPGKSKALTNYLKEGA